MLSSTSKQYDAKKYPLCPPWDCQRGRSYYDEFIPDLTSSLGSRSDDYDLALTLSLSSPAYMLIKHSLAPSIPSLYPRPCSSTAPSRRQPFP